MFGRMVGTARQALPVFGAMFAMSVDRRRRRAARRAARLAGAARLRREHHAGATARAAATWPTRRCASASPTPSHWAVATTNASNGAVNGGHDALTPAGGAVPLVNIFIGEVIFGGVGSGIYGMIFFIVHRGVRRGPDGRPDARVPGQEDRGARDQARGDRGALRADAGARPDGDRDRHRRAASRRSTTRPRTASPRRSTPTTRSRQQRQRVRRLRRDRVLRPHGHDRPLARAASCRCSPRSRSAARSPPRRPSRPRPARSAPTAARSPCCSSGIIMLTAGLMVFPALTLGPIVEGLSLMPHGAPALAARRGRADACVFGLVYPLVMTGLRPGRLPEPGERQPDRAQRRRRLQARRPGVHDAALLPRAAVGDRPRLQRGRRRPSRTSGRRTPTSRRTCAQRRTAILKLERPYNPGLTIGDIPVDAVTTSASGIDPRHHARLRPAAGRAHRDGARAVAPDRVQQLIDDNTDGRSLGFLGEPGVNVLELNLALDKETA